MLKNAFANFKLNERGKRLFGGLLLIYGLYVLPILLSGRAFKDDNPRLLYGYTGWADGDGRPLTEFIIELLSGGGEPICDMTPLPHVLSIVLMTYSATVFVSGFLFKDRQRKSLLGETLCASVVFMSPFLLENLSYRLDVIGHVLSIAAMLFIFALEKNDKKKVDLWLSFLVFLFGLVTLCTYQTAIGIVVALCALDVLIRIVECKKQDWNLQLHRLIPAGMALVAYKFVVLPLCHASSEGRNFLLGEALSNALFVYGKVFEKTGIYLSEGPLPVFVALGLMILVFDFVVIRRLIRLDCRIWVKALSAVYVIVAPLLVFMLSFSPVAMVSDVNVSPRTMIALAAFMAYFAYVAGSFLCEASGIRLASFLVLPFVGFAFVYIYVYGAAEKHQAEWDRYIAYNLVHDIEEVNCSFEYSEMTIVGNPGHTPFMDTVPYSYNIIFYNFSNAGWYGGEFIRGYTRPYLEYSDADYEREDLVLEKNSTLYNIYSLPEEGRIVILFR